MNYSKPFNKVLADYLCPNLAREAADRLLSLVQPAAVPQLKRRPLKTQAAPAAAPAKRRGRALNPASNRRGAAAALPVEADNRLAMRFKRKAYWAQRRAASGAPPLPGDAEVLAAVAKGHIIDVRPWTGTKSA